HDHPSLPRGRPDLGTRRAQFDVWSDRLFVESRRRRLHIGGHDSAEYHRDRLGAGRRREGRHRARGCPVPAQRRCEGGVRYRVGQLHVSSEGAMKITAEELKTIYGNMSDEELLSLDREHLTEVAVQIHSAELERRGLNLDAEVGEIAEEDQLTPVASFES